MKIALVHDWLTNFAGAEKCLLAFSEIWPEAPIYTSLFDPKNCPQFKGLDVRTSWLQKIPKAINHHQKLLPLFPLAFESFDFSDYDIVLSSSHACAKGIITKPKTLHACYCYTPMRYAWDDSVNYIKKSGMAKGLKGLLIHPIISWMRVWDRAAAERVDDFIGISAYVAKRIKKYYKRESIVIHPPVDVERIQLSEISGGYFLACGRIIAYKRFDLLVEAARVGKFPLVIVGDGPELQKLIKSAPENVKFTGRVSDEQLDKLLSYSRAFLFPQEEDFGIAPVEAMAAGKPVIALQAGGALDYVEENKTGVFFKEQTVESLLDAINRFETMKFEPKAIRLRALTFSKKFFCEKIKSFVEKSYLRHKEQYGS